MFVKIFDQNAIELGWLRVDQIVRVGNNPLARTVEYLDFLGGRHVSYVERRDDPVVMALVGARAS